MVVSRAAMVELAGSLSYAREEKGLSEALVEGADLKHSLASNNYLDTYLQLAIFQAL